MAAGRAGERRGEAVVRWLAVFTLATPLLVMAAVIGARFGGMDLGLAYDVLTLRIGRVLAWAGLAAALWAVWLARRDWAGGGWAGRAAWAALALVVASVSVGAYLIQDRRLAVSAPLDVTTDAAEPPGLSRRAQDRREGAGVAATTPAACPGLVAVPTQVAPETAAQALRAAGFETLGAAAFRAEGVHEGFWFGFTHDAVIRIRPGRTDVRVIARDPRPQGGQACRLAKRIMQGLAEG